MTEQPVGPRCGNNPNARLTAADRKAVDDFKGRLALRAAAKPYIDRAVWVDGDPLMEVIAVTLWEHCARDDQEMPQAVRDDPRTIAAFAAAVVQAYTERRTRADRAAMERVRAVLETEAVVGRSALEYRGLVASALMADEPPLSPYYEHPECGFHWHGRDGMDIPMRDGQPVCPRCELRRLTGVAPAAEAQPAADGWRGATEIVPDREVQRLAATGLVGYQQDRGRLLHCLHHKPAPASRYVDFQEVTADDLPDGGICVHPSCGADLLAVLPPPVSRADVATAAPVKQRADCTELEWAEQERARFERLYTRETVRADLAEKRAEAMERAMESTAADALAHRGCHRDLMAQCLRAERAEAEAERLRAELAEEMRKHNNTIAVAAGRTVDAEESRAETARLRAELRRMADEAQPSTEAPTDPSWPRRAWDLGLLHKGGDPHHCPACLKQPEPPKDFICPGAEANAAVLAHPQPAAGAQQDEAQP